MCTVADIIWSQDRSPQINSAPRLQFACISKQHRPVAVYNYIYASLHTTQHFYPSQICISSRYWSILCHLCTRIRILIFILNIQHTGSDMYPDTSIPAYASAYRNICRVCMALHTINFRAVMPAALVCCG